MFPRLATIATLLLTATASAALAQTARPGRADLRYAAPMAEKLTYVAVDSMNMVLGMPTGDMAMTGYTHTRVDVAFTTSRDSVRARIEVKEIDGQFHLPMGGSMPVGGELPAAIELMLSHKGMNFDQDDLGMAPSMNPQELMAQSRVGSVPLVRLPGRELTTGQMWTDTVTTTQTVDALNLTMNLIVHGTYVRDTVMAGRTLNVLDFRNVMTVKSKGTMQGVAMEQDMTMSSIEQVLWDSARHVVVERTAASEMTMDMKLPGMGEMRTTGKISSRNRIVD